MRWRIPLIIREAHSLPRSRAAFSSIILVCNAPSPEIVPHGSQTHLPDISLFQMSSNCDKPPRGGRKCKWHTYIFFLSSRSNRELKIFMGEVIPSSKPPSAPPPKVFSHPSLCVDVKSQPWGSQTQTMWSLRGPSEAFPSLSSQSAGRFLFV